MQYKVIDIGFKTFKYINRSIILFLEISVFDKLLTELLALTCILILLIIYQCY